VERLRRELLAEAREVAAGVPGPGRERLLGYVAASAGRHLAFVHGAAAADELASPLWRAGAWAALAGSAHGDAATRRARSRLRHSVKALVEEGAPGAEAGTAGLDRIVERLAEAGDFALAGRLCARFPDDTRARDSLLAALLSGGRRREALDLALRAPPGPARDGALEAVADAFAGAGGRDGALAAAESIADPFERERVRLDVLCERTGAEPHERGTAAMREVRGALSALYAAALGVRACLWDGDESGAREFAGAAARIAADSVDEEHRTRALALAARLRTDTGDVDGALATARLIPAGPERRGAVESAMWRLAPEDEQGPVAVRAIRGRAADDEEREVAAYVVARVHVERRDLAGASRWLRRVRDPALRSPVLQGIGGVLLERGDAAGAARVLGQVLPALRDGTTFRGLAIEQLRRGDEEGAAATLEGMVAGRGWAAGSLGGLAARYGQAERLRDWARARLGPVLRVRALLGAAADLDDPFPDEHHEARVFR
jgi:hypothetical protein